ncbi:ABC-type sugar transport system substrate-binding protein [Mesorhizobium abyssinicae]
MIGNSNICQSHAWKEKNLRSGRLRRRCTFREFAHRGATAAIPQSGDVPCRRIHGEFLMKTSILGLFAAGLLACAVPVGAASAAGIAGAPAPFDKGGVKVALVTFISAGDFFQAYQAGATKQAKALDIDLQIFSGRQDAAAQRDQIEQAINLGVQAIIIDHGQPEALKDVAQKALDAGIKVVAFDVNLDNPKIPQVEQSDHELAKAALGQALKDNGTSFHAGYVYVAGFAPLDRRNEIWDETKKANPGIVEKARWGTVNDTTAVSTADQTKAAFQANPDISVVFAPYDEFARGVKLATDELGISGKVKIYSADVSTGRHHGDHRGRKPVGRHRRHQSGCRRRGFGAGRGQAGRRRGSGTQHRRQAGAADAGGTAQERHQDGRGSRCQASRLRPERRGRRQLDSNQLIFLLLSLACRAGEEKLPEGLGSPLRLAAADCRQDKNLGAGR